MAFVRVQGNSFTDNANAHTIAVTISAVGSGNCVCGIVSWDYGSGADCTGVADNQSNTYNLEATVSDTTHTQRSKAFSLTNITNAPVTITATFTSALDPPARKILVDEFSGGSTVSSDERDSTAHGGQYEVTPGTGGDAIDSGTFTTTQNGDLLYGACIGGGTTTLASVGTSFSSGTSDVALYAGQTEYRTQATAGSGTAATFTQAAAADRMTFLISVKAPAAAPEEPLPRAFSVHQGGARLVIKPIGY